jgi:hypothetical protein
MTRQLYGVVRSRMRRIGFVFALFLVISLLSGCSLLPALSPARSTPGKSTGPGVPVPNAGKLMVTASLGSLSVTELSNAKVLLTLVKDGQMRQEELPIVDSAVSASINNLLPGVWKVTLQVIDAEGITTYEALSNASVLPETTATVSLVLRPLPGVLEVRVNPAVHPDLAVANLGRIYVNPGGYASMNESSDGVLVGTKELAPGNYDFSITLFTDSYYASDRIYESPWSPVAIHAGRTTQVEWNPVTGICSVLGTLDAPPPAPAGLQLAAIPQGLLISWDPVPDAEGDLAGYRIYLRDNVLGKFQVIHENPPTKTTFTYPESEIDANTTLEVTVTAFDVAKQESHRSPVATITY